MSPDGQLTWTGRTCGGGLIMHPSASKTNTKKKMQKHVIPTNIPSFVSKESQMEHMGMAGLHT